MNLNINFKAGAVLACALVLSACGGGSGSNNNTDPGVVAKTGVYFQNNVQTKFTSTNLADNSILDSGSFISREEAFYVEFTEDEENFIIAFFDGLTFDEQIIEFTKQQDGSYVSNDLSTDFDLTATISALNATGFKFELVADETIDSMNLRTEIISTSSDVNFIEDDLSQFFEDPSVYLKPLNVNQDLITYYQTLRPVFYKNNTSVPQEVSFEFLSASPSQFDFADVFIRFYDSSINNFSSQRVNLVGDVTSAVTVAPGETIYIDFENTVELDGEDVVGATVSLGVSVQSAAIN